MNSIRLQITDGYWIADMSNAKDSDLIQSLFGTRLIPTPFTSGTSFTAVQHEIQKMNPDHIVS